MEYYCISNPLIGRNPKFQNVPSRFSISDVSFHRSEVSFLLSDVSFLLSDVLSYVKSSLIVNFRMYIIGESSLIVNFCPCDGKRVINIWGNCVIR